MYEKIGILVEELCDCEGRRLNGRAREIAFEIRALLSNYSLPQADGDSTEPPGSVAD